MSIVEQKWYTRPVFSVSNMEKSLQHYRNLLGFEQAWKYEEDSNVIVTQVCRGNFELILAGNLDRVGGGRVFISLSDIEMDILKKDIEENHIVVEHIHWGYPAIQIRDPDGNEMILPQESQ